MQYQELTYTTDRDGTIVDITGPWDDLSYQPDLSGAIKDIAKDPSKVLDTVKGVTGGSGGFGKLLEGITGGGAAKPLAGQQPAPQPEGQPKQEEGGLLPDPGKLLKGLFGD